MKFFSKHTNLRLVLEPTITASEGGRQVMKGMNDRYRAGMTVEFQNGMYDTAVHSKDVEEKVIEDLTSHPEHGIKFFSEKGDNKPKEEGKQMQQQEQELAEKAGAKCPQCGKEFETQFGLKGHMRVHNQQ